MRLLAVPAALAELADLATSSPEREANPLAAEPLAVLAKVALVVFLVAGAWAVGPRWKPVLVFATCIGLIGAWSNVR